MATPESIAIRRSDALASAELSLRVIAEATGAVIAPYPDDHKRLEVRPAIEAEWLAEALESIARAVDPNAEALDLSKLKRDELNVYALDHGVDDPESFGTKAELIAAIESAPTEEPEPLNQQTREELNAKADELGIEDAASLPNKDAVIAAIEQHESD